MRIKILASGVPLLIAGLLTRMPLPDQDGPRCIALGDASIQITHSEWQAQEHVSFTDDPARATVRVQIVDGPEMADFAVVDDASSASESENCGRAPRLVSITSHAANNEPVILLTRNADADYRVYVQSRTFSARDAAALIVTARAPRAPIRSAAL